MTSMTAVERRSVAVLASIYGLRIFGLFLILPVFAVYAAGLEGQTPFLVGLALGAYGLTQALLQIPFGAVSDRLGRKPVIVAGLLLFAAGSVIAALADSIWGVVLGRAIQGAGAIPAVVMALASDLTRDEQRTKAMAVIGATIGATFILSLVLAPPLAGWVGVEGIFWLTAALALAAIGVLLASVPTPVRAKGSRGSWRQLPEVARDPRLLRLNAGIFFLHLALTAMFVALPPAIVSHLGLDVHQHWKLYLPTMTLALLAMVPFIILGNRRGWGRRVMLGAIALLTVAEVLLFFGYQTLIGLFGALWVFFTAFNLLEAMLPSLISRQAPPHLKGAAIGIYSTAQFLGAFAGGLLGGLLVGAAGAGFVFLACAALLALWLLIALPMAEPELAKTHQVRLGPRALHETAQLAERLAAVPGVREAVVIAEEGVAYLKVDPGVFDASSVREFGA